MRLSHDDTDRPALPTRRRSLALLPSLMSRALLLLLLRPQL
jgi:hypothetical protein